MSDAVDQLKTQVSTLSAPERADLAYFLLSSLDHDEDGAEQDWESEIARRAAEVQGGAAIGRPAEEVIAKLRERYP